MLDNEQVHTTYYISTEKSEDLLKNLSEKYPNKKFNTIFFVDDFTASGTSFFREEDGKLKGKLGKFFDHLFLQKKTSLTMLLEDKPSIYMLFYIATEEALQSLKTKIKNWKNKNNIQFDFHIEAIQVLDEKLKVEILHNHDFLDIAEKYFDTDVLDTHYKKGKCDNPHLGFNECALPIILNHNTPNNSLPILWYEKNRNKALFQRITRHKEE